MNTVIDHLAKCIEKLDLDIAEALKHIEHLELKLANERDNVAELRKYNRESLAAIKVLLEAEGQ